MAINLLDIHVEYVRKNGHPEIDPFIDAYWMKYNICKLYHV